MNKKALVLLSGGLDSTLALRLIKEQGIELEAINFTTCFCTCTRKGCKSEAKKSAEALGIPLKMVNITKEYLEVVKNPRYGYGSNMNPCIDCRIFMFKKAKEYMKECGASFVITGEVLGERPMSQRRDALDLIERKSDLTGLILRPLSAKVMKPTIAEEKGVVDRNRLLDIKGRSRKPQMGLAAMFQITDYPCPAGGCLLTNSEFGKKVKDLIEHDAFTPENVKFLRLGRHFRLSPKTKAIVGRNHEENIRLLNLIDMTKDAYVEVEDLPGPITVIRGEVNLGIPELAGSITARYTKLNDMDKVSIRCYNIDIGRIDAARMTDGDIETYRIG